MGEKYLSQLYMQQYIETRPGLINAEVVVLHSRRAIQMFFCDFSWQEWLQKQCHWEMFSFYKGSKSAFILSHLVLCFLWPNLLFSGSGLRLECYFNPVLFNYMLCRLYLPLATRSIKIFSFQQLSSSLNEITFPLSLIGEQTSDHPLIRCGISSKTLV